MHQHPSTEELAAWIRLAMEPGLGPAQARQLLAAVGLPQDIYRLSTPSLAKHLPHDLARQLAGPAAEPVTKAIALAEKWLAEPGHHILTLADPAYPAALLDSHDPPLMLYVNGLLDTLAHPAIAVVGARSATAGGTDNATAFSSYLANQGWCIVSGLAHGIDAAAHEGALRAGGRTIATLATGADLVYPAANRDLAHRIAKQGALISEFPLGTRALPYQFPKRNRIVAGLARGVLVVEAAKKSGSLITARLASEMGREVFAIPGSIHSPLSRGCHELIRQGAKLVESGQDIHEELGKPLDTPAGAVQPAVELASSDSPVCADTRPVQPRLPLFDPETPEAQVLDALGYDPVDTDVLQCRTGLEVARLVAVLMQLELTDVVERLGDGRYQRR